MLGTQSENVIFQYLSALLPRPDSPNTASTANVSSPSSRQPFENPVRDVYSCAVFVKVRATPSTFPNQQRSLRTANARFSDSRLATDGGVLWSVIVRTHSGYRCRIRILFSIDFRSSFRFIAVDDFMIGNFPIGNSRTRDRSRETSHRERYAPVLRTYYMAGATFCKGLSKTYFTSNYNHL
jgi:hypothetical protein